MQLTQVPIGASAFTAPAAAESTEGAPSRRAQFIGPPASSIPGIVKRLTSPLTTRLPREATFFPQHFYLLLTKKKKKNWRGGMILFSSRSHARFFTLIPLAHPLPFFFFSLSLSHLSSLSLISFS